MTAELPAVSNLPGQTDHKCDCCVIGTGPAGLAAALSLAAVGANVIVAGPGYHPTPARPDTRTIAIFSGGINLLRRIGAWEACKDASEPLTGIRIIDDTGRLLRSPETLFRSREIGAEAFGYNVPLQALIPALHSAIAGAPDGGAATPVTFLETPEAIDVTVDGATDRLGGGNSRGGGGDSGIGSGGGTGGGIVTLEDGTTIEVGLIAGADGRSSLAREAAGIAPITWDYDQAAVVFAFAHSRPHDGISTEFHGPNGPFTTVPMPGGRSSLVWVESKGRAEEIKNYDEATLIKAMEDKLQGLLGRVSNVGPRAHFPLSGMAARSLGANRVALIGEAGHVVPPIGAQGLNLGLRDAAALADAVGDALKMGKDPGDASVLAQYRNSRRGDVLSRTLAIDLLNRTLLSGLLPAQALRGAGLHALHAFPALRHLIMREGIQPERSLPSLMREPL